jgi:hypothetical protein
LQPKANIERISLFLLTIVVMGLGAKKNRVMNPFLDIKYSRISNDRTGRNCRLDILSAQSDVLLAGLTSVMPSNLQAFTNADFPERESKAFVDERHAYLSFAQTRSINSEEAEKHERALVRGLFLANLAISSSHG